MQRDISDKKIEVDLSDKKIFDLVQRSDTKQIVQTKTIVEEDEKNVVKYKRTGSLTNFIKKIFIIIICLLLIYLTIFRYVLGYNFLKNKDYKKGAAVLSP